MKPRRRQEAIAKPSHGARDLLIVLFMSTKKSMVPAVLAVVAKCRELWERLAGSSSAVAHSAANDDVDYFRWSYEFSCTATPVVPAVKGWGTHRRRRRLPPCVGGRQAKEMLASPFAGRSAPECSLEAGAEHEIDGLAEEFINRFYEQLRLQSAANALI